MSNRLFVISTFGAALGCGLNAGVFFAFSAFVMEALARLPPPQGVAAMNSINVFAVTPLFMTVLFGTVALSLLPAAWSLFTWERPGAAYLLAGAAIYTVGAIVVTVVFNVPWNDALAAVNPLNVEGERQWNNYLAIWTAWNHVRTVAALVAAALLTIGLCLRARGLT